MPPPGERRKQSDGDHPPHTRSTELADQGLPARLRQPGESERLVNELLELHRQDEEALARSRSADAGQPLSYRVLTEKYGMPAENIGRFEDFCQDYGVVIDVRPTTASAPEHLGAGARPKPELIKDKTITAADTFLGARRDQIGLVGFFKPHSPNMSAVPKDLHDEVAKRYDKRLHDWTTHRDDIQRAADLIDVRDRVIHDRFTGRPFTGDHDVFDVRWADGQPMSRADYEFLTTEMRLRNMGVEHGAHIWWLRTAGPLSEGNQRVYTDIVADHSAGGKEPLIRLGQGVPTGVWHEPGPSQDGAVDRLVSSPEAHAHLESSPTASGPEVFRALSHELGLDFAGYALVSADAGGTYVGFPAPPPTGAPSVGAAPQLSHPVTSSVPEGSFHPLTLEQARNIAAALDRGGPGVVNDLPLASATGDYEQFRREFEHSHPGQRLPITGYEDKAGLHIYWTPGRVPNQDAPEPPVRNGTPASERAYAAWLREHTTAIPDGQLADFIRHHPGSFADVARFDKAEDYAFMWRRSEVIRHLNVQDSADRRELKALDRLSSDIDAYRARIDALATRFDVAGPPPDGFTDHGRFHVHVPAETHAPQSGATQPAATAVDSNPQSFGTPTATAPAHPSDPPSTSHPSAAAQADPPVHGGSSNATLAGLAPPESQGHHGSDRTAVHDRSGHTLHGIGPNLATETAPSASSTPRDDRMVTNTPGAAATSGHAPNAHPLPSALEVTPQAGRLDVSGGTDVQAPSPSASPVEPAPVLPGSHQGEGSGESSHAAAAARGSSVAHPAAPAHVPAPGPPGEGIGSRLSTVDLPHAPSPAGLGRFARAAGGLVGALAWEVALPVAAQYAADWIQEKYYLEPTEHQNFRTAIEAATPAVKEWVSANRSLIEEARRAGPSGEVYVHVRFNVIHYDTVRFDDEGNMTVDRAPGEYHLQDHFDFNSRSISAVEQRPALIEDLQGTLHIRREEVVVSVPIDMPPEGSLEAAANSGGWQDGGSGEGRIGLEQVPRPWGGIIAPQASTSSQSADMVFTPDEIASGGSTPSGPLPAADMTFTPDEVERGLGGAKDVAPAHKIGDPDGYSFTGDKSEIQGDKGHEFSDKSQDNGDPEEPGANDGKLTTGGNHKDEQYQALESGAPG